LVADNGRNGIFIEAPSGSFSVNALLNRVEAYNNSKSGISVINFGTGTVKTTEADSVAANNGGDGFTVSSVSGAASLMVVRSVAANNGAGISADGASATLRVGQSAVTGNTTSWSFPNGGTLRSYGDNNIDGNGDGDPAAPTTIAKK